MSRVVHFEIHAANPEAAIAFYGGLFGWTFSQWGDEPYWMITTGDPSSPGIDGGLMPRQGGLPEEMQAVNAYVCTAGVDDLEESVAKMLSLGGTLAVPKMPVPGHGWLAYGKDPDGSIFGMMQYDPEAA